MAMEGSKRGQDCPEPMGVEISKNDTFSRHHQWDMWK
jgi:hypothetical protein